jgi:CrcB protein
MQAFLPFVLVGLGSMAGGVSRYGISLWTQNISVFSIPYGTLISNIAGCLIVGVIAGISGKSELLSSEMRLLLATGFCGGFTTMSSFIYELGQFSSYRTRNISSHHPISWRLWPERVLRLYWG